MESQIIRDSGLHLLSSLIRKESVSNTGLNHPLVQDFQIVYLFHKLLADISWYYFTYALEFFLYLYFAWVDMCFFSFWLGPIMIVGLPIMAVTLLSFPELIENGLMDSNYVLRIIKQWADAATWPIWLVAYWFGMQVFDDSLLPVTFLIQWALLPINWLNGIIVTIFFPVETVALIYIIFFYPKYFMAPGSS